MTVKVHCGANRLMLGRQGENNARTLEIDIADWRREFGAGTVQLLHQRAGDDAPYPCAVQVDGDTVRWTVTNVDTAQSGLGRAELRYYAGEVLAKSVTFLTEVRSALGPPTEDPPEAAQDWVDRVLEAANQAEDDRTAAETAKTGAETAAIQAEQAKAAAETAKSDAQEASDRAMEANTDAQEAADRAVEANTDAQTAKAAAQAAQASAESAASSAASLASAASESALRAASDAKSAEDARDSVDVKVEDVMTMKSNLIDYHAILQGLTDSGGSALLDSSGNQIQGQTVYADLQDVLDLKRTVDSLVQYIRNLTDTFFINRVELLEKKMSEEVEVGLAALKEHALLDSAYES